MAGNSILVGFKQMLESRSVLLLISLVTHPLANKKSSTKKILPRKTKGVEDQYRLKDDDKKS